MLKEGTVLILSCLGVVQALFLCIYLFTLKRSNIFLALVLLGLTIRIGKAVLHTYMPLDPWIRNLGISGLLLAGPFLWFYGKALFEKTAFSRKYYFHLIPFILFVALCKVIPNRGDFTSLFIYALVFAHLGVYLILSWIDIASNYKEMRLLPWYRNIVAGISVIWLLYICIFVGIIPFYILGAVSFAFLIYVFSFLLLKRHVFQLEKYANTGTDQVTSKKLLHQLKELFEQKKVYLNSELSLKMIADNLSTTPREVSQAINEYERKTFPEFVNQYRIANAKLLLAKADSKEKIETIAYECGFGNVTSFNLAFKAETQLTPSQYRNQFLNAD